MYFKSFFKVFYYYNICQFCFILKKSQGIISYATLDIVYIYFKTIKLLMYTFILKKSREGFQVFWKLFRSISSQRYIFQFYWIYNLIRVVFFQNWKMNFSMKKMYNSIIQSIAHQKNCASLAAKNESIWFNLMWTVFQWGRSASTWANGSQKGQGLGYKAGGVKLPIHCFPNSSQLE